MALVGYSSLIGWEKAFHLFTDKITETKKLENLPQITQGIWTKTGTQTERQFDSGI